MVTGNDWDDELSEYFNGADFKELMRRVDEEYAAHTCYPPREKLLSAYKECPFESVKAVIIGQDPYHNEGEADGKCFSTSAPVKPPSLVNILAAIENDYLHSSKDGNLSRLARQGVLMLNTSLSVRKNQPLSHAGIGWDKLISLTIDKVNSKDGIVFLLWGSFAKKMVPDSIRRSTNLYLETVHPSPLSAYRGFLTCGHFKAANEFLNKQGKKEIIW